MKSIFLFLIIYINVNIANESCVQEPNSLCFDPTCAQPLFDSHAGQSCICNSDNIGSNFLECDPISNTRTLQYFWRPPATCLGGTLPEPISGLPCNISCDIGTYFDVNTTQCNNCSVGTMSSGDGLTWYNWLEWPAQFSTYCASGIVGQNCSSWRLLGEYTDSGNNMYLNLLESILELRIFLIVDGYVEFEYMVSAEQNFDGLWFIVDQIGIFFTSNTNWTTYTFPLTAGYHTIQWEYRKDITITANQDRASLSYIYVKGTTLAPVKCQECPIGHYQDQEGESSCKNCPANTFNSDVIGASICESCPEFTYSFPGSISCTPIRECNLTGDYTWSYTPCINGTTTQIFSWVLPAACDTEFSILPPNETQSCTIPNCPPGTTNSSGVCQYCNPGYASSGLTQCNPCSKGQSGSLRIRYFDSWSSWPDDTGNFSTGCEGSCLTNGWRLGNWFTDSGLGNGPNTQVWLELDVLLSKGFNINFTFIDTFSSEDQLLFSVNNYNVRTFIGNNCSWSPTTISFNPRFFDGWGESRSFKFRWTYIKNSPIITNSDCDRAIITSINVTGVAQGLGGSPFCQGCASGTISNSAGEATCQSCPPGESSQPNSTACFSCPNGTVAEKPGSPVCLMCGVGTIANSNNTSCAYDCSSINFVNEASETTTYNISSLGFPWNVSYGGIIISGTLCNYNPICPDTHICGLSENITGYIDLGNIVSISELASHSGISMSFNFGENFGGYNCSTTVNLRCDNADANTLPIVEEISLISESCESTLIWNSVKACPLCTSSDYSPIDGPCTNGFLKRSYFKTNLLCFGGINIPTSQSVPCSQTVNFNTSTVIIGSVIGGGFLVAAICGLVFLYYRNKKLFAAYSSLKNNIPLEETD